MPDNVQIARRAMTQRHPTWEAWTLSAYLDWTTTDFATAPLVATDDLTMTYADIVDLSRKMAAGLYAIGARPGERVVLVMANYPVTVPLLFAIWRIGAIAVPLNTLYRVEELALAIREADCALIIAMGSFGARQYAADLDMLAPGWRTGETNVFPSLRASLVFDEADPDSLIASLTGNGATEPPEVGAPCDPAVIMFTSGTTGTPKGVVLTHDNLLRAAYGCAYHHAYEEGRRAAFSLPLYHGFGLVVGLLSGLVVGGSIVPLLRFNAAALLQAIARHRASFLMGVPTMTVALLEEAKSGRYDLSSLTAIHSAAAPTPSWVWSEIQRVFGCTNIFTSYGQTETTATLVCTQPGDPIEIVSSTQGCIVDAGVAGLAEEGGKIAQFKTIDPESGEDLPRGAAGELCTRGPLNSLGYFRRPEESAKLFLPGGWLRMGDLGHFREDGNLYLTGRTKELYKSRGELVSPKEIELLLTTHEAISQAFLVGMPDDLWGECGCAWIIKAEGHAIDAEEVREFLAARVAKFKMPRDIWFIEADALPKTGTGKVQKSVLKLMGMRLLEKGAAESVSH